VKHIIHSYTFRDYPLEHAFLCANRYGYDGIELQPCHFNPDDVEEEVRKAAALADEYGIPLHCVDYIGDFIADDESTRQATVDIALRTIDACAEHGIPLINGFSGWIGQHEYDYGENGSVIATQEHYERAAEAYRRLAHHGQEQGVKVAIEIHMNTIHDSVASTHRLLDMIGHNNVFVTPDPGNMFTVPHAEKAPSSLDSLKDSIAYCHFKNAVPALKGFDFSVKLDNGYIDTYKWIAKLDELQFHEAVCIEYCGEGDPHPSARDDLIYFKECVALLSAAVTPI